MITFTKLGEFGRLGNQLFQIASTLSIAKKYDTPCVFPTAYQHYNDSLPKGDLTSCQIYREPRFEYDMPDLNLYNNQDLQGYFQSYRYFDWCWDEIKHYFEFDRHTLSFCSKLVAEAKLNATEIIAVHVRRGDYLNLEQYHPVQTKEYYYEAMSRFPVGSLFIMLSDDIDWCRENFKADNVLFIHSIETEDLCIMSLCDHQIIANSSFSWWGAWLNKNPNKKVIAPRKWFGEAYANKSTADLLPTNWIQI